ncbi:hypothetical protein [Mycolicibacter senuensis]|uniref:Uncharacterized protein n=1 Tax=Mycolicibacter longobardus TaxID=1108812 RepID=A0A1X1YBF5_9MYCO|nr:hypothetical protein [Mycolicibacter senuensis]ORW08438.1 hypothetical protein AWC16_18735 [Mycolicibacter longobardus]RAV04451.1 hypothetical protein DQP56_01135 [Mycolicibacter senuensis]
MAAVAANPRGSVSGSAATNFETTATGVTANTTIATGGTGRSSYIAGGVITLPTVTAVAALAC